jgi:hypothetical protein
LGRDLLCFLPFNERGANLAIDAVAGRQFQSTGTALVWDNKDGVAWSNSVAPRLEFPDTAQLNPQRITVAARFRLNGFPNYSCLVSKAQTGPTWTPPYLSYLLRVNSVTQVEFSIGGTAYQSAAGNVPTLVGGVSYTAIGTYDGVQARTYVDGFQVGAISYTGTINYNSAYPVSIGWDEGTVGGGDYFPGYLEYAAIWGRALSAGEVKEFTYKPWQVFQPIRRKAYYLPPAATTTSGTTIIKRWGSTKPPASTQLDRSHPLANRLVGCWPMNEGGGRKITNLVTKNDATLVNNGWAGAPTFDGSTSYGVTSNIDLSPYRKITVAWRMWWNAFANDDALAMELSANVNANYGAFLVNPNSSNLGFGCGTVTPAGYTVPTYARPSAKQWHHYAMTIDMTKTSAAVDLYVDGILQTPTDRTYDAAPSGNFANQPLYLMSRGGGALFGNGRMEALGIWGRMLTANEIADMNAKPFELLQPTRIRAYSIGTTTMTMRSYKWLRR